MAEAAAQQHITDRLLGTCTQYFYGVGIVGYSAGATVSSPYVDLPLNLINTPARVNGSPGNPNTLAASLDGSGVRSSLESTALEQTQGKVAGFTAASTVKLIDLAIQNNDTILDINNGNSTASQQAYSNSQRAQLAPNYSAADLASIDQYVAAGFRVIAPLHGKLSVGKWTGSGFKAILNGDSLDAFFEIISGGLNGGFGGWDVSTSIFAPDTDSAMSIPSVFSGLSNTSLYSPSGITWSSDGTLGIGDPLDHQKGSYLYRHDDLTVGPQGFPLGLTMTRSYDSGAQDTTGPLGAGWTHDYAITATADSDGFSGLGQSCAACAASAIAALYVSSDVVKTADDTTQPSLQQFALETVVHHWLTDQLTQNVVNVTQGWNSEQFTQLADGSYAPRAGSAAILDSIGGNFRYRTAEGVTMLFNASGQISSWTASSGGVVNFVYSGGAFVVRFKCSDGAIALV